MNSSMKQWLLFGVTLTLIGGTAGALTVLRSHQRLGPPGLVATPVPGSLKMKFELPENVLGFTSTNVPEAPVVTGMLPKDTSFAQRRYFAPDGAWANANIILMGADRTSIHRPSYCLPGQGWKILKQTEVPLHIAGPHPYDLPVMRWDLSNTFKAPDGSEQAVSGLYVFWFVTKNQTADSINDMGKHMILHLLRHGELQRWAYISWFTACRPGQEEATFARIKPLIAAAVPRFQLPPADAK
jgi:hypothetical protein